MLSVWSDEGPVIRGYPMGRFAGAKTPGVSLGDQEACPNMSCVGLC